MGKNPNEMWRWKPPYVRFFYYIEDIIDFFLKHVPQKKFVQNIRGWVATFALTVDREALKSLEQAMEDVEHGRFLTYEEAFGEEKKR